MSIEELKVERLRLYKLIHKRNADGLLALERTQAKPYSDEQIRAQLAKNLAKRSK